MSSWEYKVITSGKGGFATPALLEKFLNDLGRDQWEIVDFHSHPDNFLAFTGLARRTTQRDWTLEDAAAAAAKAEAEKLRAEFEAKFKAATTSSGGGATAEERAPSFLEEKAAPDDGFRKPVDTSRDDDPESDDDEKDEWDKLTAAEEDELPTFFEAIKPHMRRNQRGPGMSVGVDYLAKKWDQSEDDLKGALVECGFVMPEDEDSDPVHLEYDGDLYWLNINRRGELWINTKEKPRPMFRSVKAQRVTIEEPAKPESTSGGGEAKSDSAQSGSGDSTGAVASQDASAPAPASGENATPRENNQNQNRRDNQRDQRGGRELPQGPALLAKIRPQMRRNRRGPGGSGSASFLARALRCNEADLRTAFTTLGLVVPAAPSDKPVYIEIGNELWWLNLDSRNGLWINGREKKAGETIASATAEDAAAPAVPSSEASPAPAGTTPEGAPTEATASSDEPASTSPVAESVAAPASAEGSAPSASEAPAAIAPASAPTEIPTSGAPAEKPVEAPAASEADSAPTPAPAAEAAPAAAPAPAIPALASVRPFLKEGRAGSVSGKIDQLAETAGQPADAFLAALVGAGLKIPDKPRERFVFVESAGEVFWLNKNAKDELWLNAKPAKSDDKDDDEEGDGSRRPRGRKKSD